MADLKISQFPFLGMTETLNLDTDKLAGTFDTGGGVFSNRGVTARDILLSIQSGEPDPFPQYLTSTEANSLYQPIGGSVQNVITYTTNRNSVSADVNSWIRFDSPTDVFYDIDQETTLDWGLMEEITIEQVGNGKVTVSMVGSTHGAIIIDSGKKPKTDGAGSVLKIRKVVDDAVGSNDRFLVYGELEPNVPNVPVLNSSSGILTIDLSLSDYYQIDITENITSIVFTNLPGASKPSTKMFEILQDSVPRTVTWPASFKWEGTAPVVSNTANAVDILAITSFDNGTTWHGTLSKGRA